MSQPGLPVSRLISVTINLSPAAAQLANVNIPMIIGDSNVIDVGLRYMSFTTLSEVQSLFGGSAPEAVSASLYFGQSPTPQQLFIGRWAKSATPGYLYCGALTAAQQTISNWTAVTNGAFKINVNGSGYAAVSGLNFSGATTLNGVASTINTALTTDSIAATCVWDAYTSQFVFQTSISTGSSATIGYLESPVSGTDISAQLCGTAATSARIVNGIAAESALTAVETLDALPIGWYDYTFATLNANTDIADSDHEAIAAWNETATNPHIYGLTTQDNGAITPGGTSDIGYILQQAKYNRTFSCYSSQSPYAAAALLGLMAGVDFEVEGSTVTYMFKPQPGVLPEPLTNLQATELDGKNYNYYAEYSDGVSILMNGICASGVFIDEQQGADWLVTEVQTDLFNLLIDNGKVPQTDSGIHLLAVQVRDSCEIGVSNGLIGPGTWNFGGFGGLSPGMFLEDGIYVYANPIATQTQSQRQQRVAPLIQVAVIFAGAVHKPQIAISVMR